MKKNNFTCDLFGSFEMLITLTINANMTCIVSTVAESGICSRVACSTNIWQSQFDHMFVYGLFMKCFFFSLRLFMMNAITPLAVNATCQNNEHGINWQICCQLSLIRHSQHDEQCSHSVRLNPMWIRLQTTTRIYFYFSTLVNMEESVESPATEW